MNSILNHPIVWIPAIAFVLAILAFLGARHSRGAVRIGLGIVAAIFVILPSWLLIAVFAPEWMDGRVRTYKAFYTEIQPGMNRDEVLAAMDKHYPAEGSRRRPKIMRDSESSLGFFMDPEHSREPNCEGIFLDFAGGKVTRKRYSED